MLRLTYICAAAAGGGGGAEGFTTMVAKQSPEEDISPDYGLMSPPKNTKMTLLLTNNVCSHCSGFSSFYTLSLIFEPT